MRGKVGLTFSDKCLSALTYTLLGFSKPFSPIIYGVYKIRVALYGLSKERPGDLNEYLWE